MALDFSKEFKKLYDLKPSAGTEKHIRQPTAEELQPKSNLQREIDERAEAHQRAAAVYREYQKNIKASEQLQAEILKGIKAGTPEHILLLKAVQAIALMTSNKAFNTVVSREISTKQYIT